MEGELVDHDPVSQKPHAQGAPEPFRLVPDPSVEACQRFLDALVRLRVEGRRLDGPDQVGQDREENLLRLHSVPLARNRDSHCSRTAFFLDDFPM